MEDWKMIGLIPASGKATRIGGLPKFALPCDKDNTPLISRHIDLMRPYCDKIVVSTTSQWENLVKMFDLDIELMVVEPSTMNDSLIKMSEKYFSTEYLVGMADTYFYGENPYHKLWASSKAFSIGFSCWGVEEGLKGKVGQVNIVDKEVVDIKDKDPECEYDYMWGALMLSLSAIKKFDKNSAHPGIDLQKLIKNESFSNIAFTVDGSYFDVGTLSGYRNLINRLEL
jgi:hypothetical protein